MIAHFSSSLHGAAVVRAMGAQQTRRFIERFHELVDANNKCFFGITAATAWFSLRLRMIAVTVLLGITGLLTVMREEIDPSLVGMAVSYGLTLEDGVSTLVFCWQWIETNMVTCFPHRSLDSVSYSLCDADTVA